MNATTTIDAPSCDAGPRQWRVALGGRFSIFCASEGEVTPKGRKSRAILAYLAAHSGERIRREQLIDLLWGDRFEAQARLSLRQCLFEIRRSAGGTLIHSDREHLWIERSALEIVDSGDEPYSGLSGITADFDDWLRIEREHRTRDSFAKLKIEAEHLLAEKCATEALPLIERMRCIDPLNEDWLRLAMRADHQAGNPSAIERRFGEFAQLLERELGVEPASDTRALRDRLIVELRGNPSPDPNLLKPSDLHPTTQPQRHGRVGLLGSLAVVSRKRRVLVATAAILSLILLAIWARTAVLEQRRQAEGMAEFMLGDLKDKLEPIGKLDAIEGVASRVLDYYKGRDNAGLSDAELRQRSRALTLLGEVENQRGNTNAADHFFKQAMAGTAEEIRRAPNDPQRLFDHAQNVFWIGDIARSRGDLKTAEANYREYQRLADRMAAIDPDSMKWRMEVLYASENIGIVLAGKRQFAQAAHQFESALQPMESVASIDRSNTEFQKEVANVLGWLADAQRAAGQFDAAVAVRQRQVAYLNDAISQNPQDVDLQWPLVPAHEGLGVLLSEQGQIDRAIEQYRLATGEADHLLSIEPNNIYWKDLAANTRLQFATDLIAAGRGDEAPAQAARGCDAAEDLVRRNPTDSASRTLQRMCLAARSRLALASGADADALSLAQRALAVARAEDSGDQVRDRYLIASVYRLIGDIQQRIGNPAGAKSAWSAGLTQLPPKVTERPWEMNERAQLLSRTGQAQDAVAIEGRLKSIGYRSS